MSREELIEWASPADAREHNGRYPETPTRHRHRAPNSPPNASPAGQAATEPKPTHPLPGRRALGTSPATPGP
ncbi:hypothetical protein [Streptomyces mirabilis]|uniref:hypothetical protein n=1 Tax=Streptomyces mirabilis TaxID=68239 RepID=UPI000B10F19C|nr:hypothetical protein [Streptomyces mirabilis]MCX4428365.1 hypothetical protein [Streptomyces mirabilis]